MQQLQNATFRRLRPDVCAQELLAAVPGIMRFIRHQMRQHRHAELTVPQFRALVFLSHGDDPSLSDMAEHLGLSLPATSRMVDLLVRRGFIDRQSQSKDRRRVSLGLTRRGKGAFRTAHSATRVALAGYLKILPPAELEQVGAAMRTLDRLFAPENCRRTKSPSQNPEIRPAGSRSHTAFGMGSKRRPAAGGGCGRDGVTT